MRTTLKTTKEKAKGEKTRRRKHPGNDGERERTKIRKEKTNKKERKKDRKKEKE